MFFFQILKTFYGYGWWHGRSDFPRNDTFTLVPIYQNNKVQAEETIISDAYEAPKTVEVEK
jgi:hypothetical protein